LQQVVELRAIAFGESHGAGNAAVGDFEQPDQPIELEPAPGCLQRFDVVRLLMKSPLTAGRNQRAGG